VVPKVHVETTIVSYLAARPSRDLVTAAHQKITQDSWDERRTAFDAYTSALVLNEAGAGDTQIARRRLEYLGELPVLEPGEGAESLAQAFLEHGAIPRSEPEDALHVALAAVHGMEFLLTWNCAHIANAELRLKLVETCALEGVELPHICTPEELMGEDYHWGQP